MKIPILKYKGPALALAAALATGLAGAPAWAAHPLASLPGSNFEIDVDANLKVDDAGKDDWASVTETRKKELTSGKTDDSYAGGAKEDDTCPGTTTGSIPPNKSDLSTFGVYEEEGDPGILHLFWTRVQEPSGTTLMDFELNQSTEPCSNGVNPVRTVDDLLIEYRIEQGGATAQVLIREWTGSVWGPAQDLTAVGAATGTINNSPIPASEADGLGALSARTFGEASIDLNFIFDENECLSLGSAFLKSRSSTSFTSQLKDFIGPQSVTISNCGSIKINKTDDAGNGLNGAEFTLYNSDGDDDFEPGTDDTVVSTCTTTGGLSNSDPGGPVAGMCTFTNVLQGEYWVDETQVPDGFDKASGLPQKVTVTADEQIELSFVDPRQVGSIIVEKVVTGTSTRIDGAMFAIDADGDPSTTGDQTTIPAVNGQTGLFCIDNLLFDTYTVVETQAPSGFAAETTTQTFTVSTKSNCADEITAGETPDLTFENTAQPTLTTSATSTATAGDDISDTATLSGGFEATGTITFNLHFNDNTCSDGSIVFTNTVPVNGDGDYTSANFTANVAGTYYWKVSYSGDASNASATHDCGAEGEVTTVNQAEPTLTTLATSSVTVGGVISDTATLSGGTNPTGTITFNLHFNDNTCSDGSIVFTDTVPVNGDGDYTSANFTANVAGTYYWKVSYSGDANNALATHACGAEGEVTTVNQAEPEISTTPKLLPNDSATLSGLFEPAGGTLTFQLYGNADCTGTALYTEEFNVTGNGTFETTNSTVFITADVTLSWLVTYSGDTNNNEAVSACDAEQQVIDFTPLTP